MSEKQTQEYNGNGNHDWELVVANTRGPYTFTTRLRVPGGWLYHVTTVHADEAGAAHPNKQSVTTTFVPMPIVVKHKV